MHQPAERTDEETLSAYLDGELPPAEAERLTARLAADPALRERLQALAAGDEATRRLFARLDERPLPRGVKELLETASPGDAPRRAENVVTLPPRGLRRFAQMPVALAASVALVAGFLLHGQLPRAPVSGAGGGSLYARDVPPASPLHDLLETGISGRPQPVDGGSARVLLTFQDTAGDYCRQVQLERAGVPLQAVACRREGGWRAEVVTFGAAADASGPYRPAGTATAPAVDAAIDGLLGSRAPLSAAEERTLVTRGWARDGN